MAKIGELRRGDCVFVRNEHAEGHEMKKSRPGVVISNAAACRHAPQLQVVYMSKHNTKPSAYHVGLADGRTVMCEHIYTCDLDRLEWMEHIGEEDMRRIDVAVERQLQLDAEHRT